MACDVPDDYIDSSNRVFSLFEDILEESWLPRLECVLLEIGFAVDRGTVNFLDTPEHRFVQELLSKQMNEGYGLIGSLHRGAFLSGHHSARSALELYAVCNYVFSKPAKTPRRINKFYQFGELSSFNLYQWAKSNGDEVAETVSQDMIAKWEQQVPGWFETYRPDLRENPDDDRSQLERQADSLRQVKSWHYPANIENMLSSFGDATWIKGIYGSLSHGTHFSPHGRLLTGGMPVGLPLSAPRQPDFRLINRLIGSLLIGLQGSIELVEENLEIDFGIDFPPIDLDE